jgi:hypothetical protein
MEVSCQLHVPGKRPRYQLDRRLGGPRSRAGRYGEENISFPCRESNPSRPARSSPLYRLSYPGFSLFVFTHCNCWEITDLDRNVTQRLNGWRKEITQLQYELRKCSCDLVRRQNKFKRSHFHFLVNKHTLFLQVYQCKYTMVTCQVGFLSHRISQQTVRPTALSEVTISIWRNR